VGPAGSVLPSLLFLVQSSADSWFPRSFFRSDKLVGTAHLKLERLENECEIREIVEVLDGRKPTGGKLEVKVRLREPLSGQDVQMVTENWLVLEPRGL